MTKIFRLMTTVRASNNLRSRRVMYQGWSCSGKNRSSIVDRLRTSLAIAALLTYHIDLRWPLMH
jgi:hypothetical protein